MLLAINQQKVVPGRIPATHKYGDTAPVVTSLLLNGHDGLQLYSIQPGAILSQIDRHGVYAGGQPYFDRIRPIAVIYIIVLIICILKNIPQIAAGRVAVYFYPEGVITTACGMDRSFDSIHSVFRNFKSESYLMPFVRSV